MTVVTSFIGLGSNLGEPLVQIETALARLAAHPQLTLVANASFYQSSAMVSQAGEQQPDYINTVAEIKTALAPLSLLALLQSIEAEQGRTRNGKRWQARTLDLDILLYGEQIIQQPELCVPHPGIPERAFVLYPLHELCPNLLIPGMGVLTELIMQYESEKTCAKLAGKAGGAAVNLVKLRSD